MPSLKLSNPFRRGADRPSLKQRAASLTASAARVMKRKPADRVTPGVQVGDKAQTFACDFIGSLDLTQADLRVLAAIHDAARMIGGVADAVGCQPRSFSHEDGSWNVVGLFADAMSEACGAVQADAVREARKREPSTDWERDLRLVILAQDTIENGDDAAVSALARDFQAIG